MTDAKRTLLDRLLGRASLAAPSSASVTEMPAVQEQKQEPTWAEVVALSDHFAALEPASVPARRRGQLVHVAGDCPMCGNPYDDEHTAHGKFPGRPGGWCMQRADRHLTRSLY